MTTDIAPNIPVSPSIAGHEVSVIKNGSTWVNPYTLSIPYMLYKTEYFNLENSVPYVPNPDPNGK